MSTAVNQQFLSQVVNGVDLNRYIWIKGAREHNLKDVNIRIPRDKVIIVTGVSGSGKSSLIIDTLYAEGQRRYVESLSSYARQFLTRMEKPDVDYILGISPAIAIEQKVSTRTSRSTVGSLTEIYDYLKLLYARTGRTISPVSGEEVMKHEVSDVVDYAMGFPEGTKMEILMPFLRHDGRAITDELNLHLQKGFYRVKWAGKTQKIEDVLNMNPAELPDDIAVVVDRIAIKKASDTAKRIADSAQIAFDEGHGNCTVNIIDGVSRAFSNRFELDGLIFEEPTPHLFSYNNPYGACGMCEGFGSIIGIDPDLIIPNKQLSVYEGAVAPWRGAKMKKWRDQFVKKSIHDDFPVHRAIKDLDERQTELLWKGGNGYKGIDDFIKYVEKKLYKIQYRVMLSRYRGRTVCPDCKGTRLRKDANYVKVGGKSITNLVLMPVNELQVFLNDLVFPAAEQELADRIMREIKNRVGFMMDVGLGYLNLNRLSNTLSGGETQRINLTRTLGSNLTNSLYILDEPSIGLHSRDTEQLIGTLRELRNLGNTVIVVEHDEDIMRMADHVIDMGPEAGIHGGHVVAEGTFDEIQKANTLTGKYLSGKLEIPVPEHRRKVINKLVIKGASQHNLQHIDVTIPLNMLTVVTGVSGSGKTTLIKKILYPALVRELTETGERPGAFTALEGDINAISRIEMIDQNPIGKSSRSNPVTYVKAYDAIRDLYSKQQLSKVRGYKPRHFSFNVDGGRCDACKGEGEQVVEMQFLADVHLVCEECGGKRFKSDVLEVKYKGKNIFDVLEMSVEEALLFFQAKKDIVGKLQPLYDVGLGYIKLGQSASTLSGGEAQRVKLAFFLTKGSSADPVLFLFDEPTTGLHFHDIKKLLKSFDALIANGHSILVIEHHMDVIKCADWVIDLGPEGGKGGGELLYQGVPEGLIKVKESHTARYLAEKL